MLGVCRSKGVQVRINRWMYLRERGLPKGLVGDSEAQGATTEGRDASRGED